MRLVLEHLKFILQSLFVFLVIKTKKYHACKGLSCLRRVEFWRTFLVFWAPEFPEKRTKKVPLIFVLICHTVPDLTIHGV